ncbi:MAG: metalloregulator ArsR/SmtB family transcription factor [bacterium]|nr:ArsR family transcriptional regulator [Gammaproteobacteria bacterium]
MDAFSVIAEPNRRLLLETVRHRPCTVNMLVEVAGLSQPAVSKHLKILKSANLVVVRPDGQKRWYELNAQPLMEVDEFLEPYRQFLSNKLDNLERHLDEMDQ